MMRNVQVHMDSMQLDKKYLTWIGSITLTVGVPAEFRMSAIKQIHSRPHDGRQTSTDLDMDITRSTGEAMILLFV